MVKPFKAREDEGLVGGEERREPDYSLSRVYGGDGISVRRRERRKKLWTVKRRRTGNGDRGVDDQKVRAKWNRKDKVGRKSHEKGGKGGGKRRIKGEEGQLPARERNNNNPHPSNLRLPNINTPHSLLLRPQHRTPRSCLPLLFGPFPQISGLVRLCVYRIGAAEFIIILIFTYINSRLTNPELILNASALSPLLGTPRNPCDVDSRSMVKSAAASVIVGPENHSIYIMCLVASYLKM
jgi:hypothetical protein